jgi:S-layer homology domain.
MVICKRFTYVLFIALLLAAITPFRAFAAEAEPFTVTQGKSGNDIQITITANNAKDLYAYEWKLQFDSKKVSFKSAASGAITGYSITPIVKDSEVTYATTKVGNKKGENGKVVLSTVLFTPIGKGSAAFSLTDVKLVSSSLTSVVQKPDVSLTAQLEAIQFTDITGHWAEVSIKRAVELGMINGYTDGTFRPNASITRAEFTAMIVRTLNLPLKQGAALTFKDKSEIPAWASDSVAAAAQAGIITGYQDNTFRQSLPINRSEIAVMVIRALGWTVDPAVQSTFADRADIPAWAEPSIARAAEAGILKGRGGNKFVPADNATRAEAVTLLLAMLDQKQ